MIIFETYLAILASLIMNMSVAVNIFHLYIFRFLSILHKSLASHSRIFVIDSRYNEFNGSSIDSTYNSGDVVISALENVQNPLTKERA